jgi:triacylglycerol lipase
MGLGQQYCRQLRVNLPGLHANFPPNRPLALGDYGVLRDDVFQRMGNIAQLGITFATIDGPASTTFQFKSQGAVDVDFLAKGDIAPGGIPVVKAGIEIRFTKQDAVFFNAAGCTVTQVDDIAAIGRALADLLRDGRWDSEFRVVTNLVRATHTTAIASADRTSEIRLEATSDALAAIDLADASVRLQTKRSRSTALEIVTASEQTPLMQLSRLRGLFQKEFRPESAAIGDAPDAFAFGAETHDPLLAMPDVEAEAAGPESMEADDEVASGAEFRPVARASDFEVERAMSAYIPLLAACYALAEQMPVAIPGGYEILGEIRASHAELAEAAAADTADPEAQEAVVTDFAAVEAAAVDGSAFGFVVRETATGAVLVCIRGTRTPNEWLHNFTVVPSPFELVPGFGQVHLGFERLYQSVRASIHAALAAVPASARLTVVGHSLGGAMGLLCAVDLKMNLSRTNLDVCTFGGPRTGKVSFRRRFDREIRRCYRVTNQFDIVPHVPSLVFGWNHVGEEIEVDGNVDDPHGLTAHLEGLRNLGQVRELGAAGVAESMALAGVVSIRVP